MKSTIFGIGLVAAAAALGLVSCADDLASPSTTAVQIGATNYVTLPPTPSTEAPPVVTGGVQPEQTHTIEAGDLPVTIAKKFNVPFAELMALNGWVLEGQFVTNFPPVGTVIRIPAGGTLPGDTVPTTAPVGETPTQSTSEPTTTIAGGGDNCAPGSYEIESGDVPINVAKKFDTTVEALNAANANTAGYDSFYVGLAIVIPGKTDC